MFQKNNWSIIWKKFHISCFIKTITFNLNRAFKYLKIKETIFYLVKLGLSYGCSEYVLCLVAQPCLFVTPWTIAPQAPLSVDSPGKNTGVGYHALLQGIFPTQGSDPGLLQCKQILYHLSPRKPMNTGVGNLSFLQGIYLTQESNQDLLCCRWVLYNLNHQGSL